MLIVDELRVICPATGIEILERFLGPLTSAMAESGINTPARQSMFLATCAHESDGFQRLSENLNYSAQGLMATWPRRFAAGEAATYARHPEQIANRVYARRMGNGDEQSGDGWRYRGAGLIQLTGRLNHLAAAAHFGVPAGEIGDWLRTPEGACRSAGWWWQDNGCSELADHGDFLGITRRVNGGTTGMESRQAYLARAQGLFA